MESPSELTALAQEIMELDFESFEVADHVDGSALGVVFTSSTIFTDSCSGT